MEYTKQWWKEAVVYQVYPRSFCDSDGDGCGDIRGIISKLDYLKYLGIDVIWLSPVYQSPNDDNGYDISDYCAIMKEFGTMEDFDALLEEAHKRGLKIVMDLVVNHTSDEHKWFVESRKSRNNPYSDYYIWRDPVNGKEPNNWGSWFGGSAWQWDENRQQYYLHIFSKKQADLNWDNPKVRQDIFSMMRWWLDKGIDGYRMDVISMISKTQEFADGPMNGLYGDLGSFCIHGPHVHEYIREMNEQVLSHYDIMTVGETAGVTLEEAVRYAGYDRNELQMVFQFEHVSWDDGDYGKWSDRRFDFMKLKQILTKWQVGMAGKGWNSLFWSNHDQPRTVSRFGNDGKYWKESAKMLATCLHMMQGTPYVYQGEEIGMTNAYFDALEDYRDIESINAYHEMVEKAGFTPEYMIKCMQCAGRDNARTPMQWSAEDGAGFTAGTPWIRLNKNYKQINAASQVNDPDSILQFYRRLIRMRHEMPILVYGEFVPMLEDHPKIFAFERVLDEEKLTVLCNFTEDVVDYPQALEGNDILISNYKNHIAQKLRPYEALVYRSI